MTTLADLIAEVAAEHRSNGADWAECRRCRVTWTKYGCPAARLAAALSVENVSSAVAATIFDELPQAVLRGLPFGHGWADKLAAALLAAITVAE